MSRDRSPAPSTPLRVVLAADPGSSTAPLSLDSANGQSVARALCNMMAFQGNMLALDLAVAHTYVQAQGEAFAPMAESVRLWALECNACARQMSEEAQALARPEARAHQRVEAMVALSEQLYVGAHRILIAVRGPQAGLAARPDQPLIDPGDWLAPLQHWSTALEQLARHFQAKAAL